MKLKSIFAVPDTPTPVSVGLLLTRIFAGAAMAQHGWPKMQNMTSWMGDAMPGFLQALAAISEFGGGIALLLGALTPLAMFGLLCTMGVAANSHISRGDAMVASGPGQGSWELAGLYFVLSLMFILAEPGKFSIDKALFGVKGSGHDPAADDA